MNNEQKPFSKVLIGDETWDLCFGEVHSVSDNSIYAKSGEAVIPFDGHRLPFRIEISEYNYVKSSGISDAYIRKGCSAKLYVGDKMVFDDFARGYEQAYRIIQDFIIKMEDHWFWYPYNTGYVMGREVAYWNQLFTITYVGINRLELTPMSGIIEKPFWMEDDDWDDDKTIVTSIVDPEIKWHVKD